MYTTPGSGYTNEPTITVTPRQGTSPATSYPVIKAVMAYEVGSIEITDGGVGYEEPPAILFPTPPHIGSIEDLSYGERAEATAQVSNGRVASIIITGAGSGYNTNTPITISAPGVATARILGTNGSVVRITHTVPGSGIPAAPSGTILTISEPETPGGVRATAEVATVSTDGTTITGITITRAGSGYIDPPTVTAQRFFSGNTDSWQVYCYFELRNR